MKFKSAFFAFIGLLLAPMSSVFAAQTVRLGSKDAWDLYVHGNGEAIAQILTAVKLMLAPDDGGGAFRYLLLFLAIVGFVVLAIRAGFDPGRNFLKMFGFIFLIWGVMYTTTGLRANVHVYDRMSNYSNVVTGVPAIVAIPASIISQTGEWLTRQLEQNFSIPSSLKVSEGGQFSLFGKVMQDMDSFVISDLNLSNSVKAYIADCAVPAMALGRVNANDFYQSAELVRTLEKAKSDALLTRFFPVDRQHASCQGLKNGGSEGESGLGILMSCSAAYDCLKDDLDTYAQALLHAKNEQWATTGVMVPFEQVMSDALAHAAASGGGNPVSRYSRPQGIILQKALANTMTGAFRDAAVRTGNNEVMMATAIAQAEQSQKSSWATAAVIFQNMMGYVYLVLQAFILAVMPVVIIGLLIPGLGSKIFSNYFQILVWLTLWSPMLAIVNFLLTVFGGAQLHETLQVAGLSMETSTTISEYSNNLVIATNFIATMVPLITWGLVKGAMAFTEFVSHGIGSSFATQAGAQASTGNVSMGNLSMDNVGMSKYSTTMTSSIGYDAVDARSSAGKVLLQAESGGAVQSHVGAVANTSETHGTNVGTSESHGWSQSMGVGYTESTIAGHQKALSMATFYNEEARKQFALAESALHNQNVSKEDAYKIAANHVENGQRLLQLADTLSSGVRAHGGFTAGFDVGPRGPGGKVGGGGVEGPAGAVAQVAEQTAGGPKGSAKFGASGGGDVSWARTVNDQNSVSVTSTDDFSRGGSSNLGYTEGYQINDSHSLDRSHGGSGGIRDAIDEGFNRADQLARQIQENQQYVEGLSLVTGNNWARNAQYRDSAGFWLDSQFDVRPDIGQHANSLAEQAGGVTSQAGGTRQVVEDGSKLYENRIGSGTGSDGNSIQGHVDQLSNEAPNGFDPSRYEGEFRKRRDTARELSAEATRTGMSETRQRIEEYEEGQRNALIRTAEDAGRAIARWAR